jgi:hypothetical protein
LLLLNCENSFQNLNISCEIRFQKRPLREFGLDKRPELLQLAFDTYSGVLELPCAIVVFFKNLFNFLNRFLE